MVFIMAFNTHIIMFFLSRPSPTANHTTPAQLLLVSFLPTVCFHITLFHYPPFSFFPLP